MSQKGSKDVTFDARLDCVPNIANGSVEKKGEVNLLNCPDYQDDMMV